MDELPAPSRTVDARGLRCPLPLVRARDDMDLVEPGGILEVLATDPGADHDLRSWCRRKGFRFERADEAPGVLRFLITRG
jgi:tRNA 2-thiouridine synthesizing protein A